MARPPGAAALARALRRVRTVGPARRAAAAASLVWAVAVLAYGFGFFGASQARGTAFLDGAFFLLALTLPLILIWMAVSLAEELARLRDGADDPGPVHGLEPLQLGVELRETLGGERDLLHCGPPSPALGRASCMNPSRRAQTPRGPEARGSGLRGAAPAGRAEHMRPPAALQAARCRHYVTAPRGPRVDPRRAHRLGLARPQARR